MVYAVSFNPKLMMISMFNQGNTLSKISNWSTAVKCLSSQNGRIQFGSVWAILFRRNKMHTNFFTQANNNG